MNLSLDLTVQQAKDLASILFNSLKRDENPHITTTEIYTSFKSLYSNFKNKPSHSHSSSDEFLKYLDTNRDGKVTLIDLENGFINLFCKEKIQKLYDSEDKNHIFSINSYSIEDSLLDYVDKIEEEKQKNFREELEKKEIIETENYSGIDGILRKARITFYQYDKSFTGYVERENWEALAINIYKALGFRDIKKWIRDYGSERITNEMDVDKDGKVSISDFEGFVIKVLDKDGVVLS